MTKQVAQAEELQSVVKLLREDLSKERQRCTQLELQINDSEAKAEDL